MEAKELTLIERIELVKSMTLDTWNWDENDLFNNPAEGFQHCITTELKNSDEIQHFECGSYKPGDTTNTLYLMLWLCEPRSVDFSNMYKCRLFSFASIDERYVVTVELYKYELGLYFYAPQDEIDSQSKGVWGGWPGADNHVTCTNPVGIAFFDMVKRIVEYEHDVYPGNNFVV